MQSNEQEKTHAESGFTLVEILACLVVLAIAGLTLTSFFVNAMSYAKGNQSKTVMVNLARNTLFYMQKEAVFDELGGYFQVAQETLPSGEKRKVISPDGCSSGLCAGYRALIRNGSADTSTLATILHPNINGIQYRVEISYQPNLYKTLKANGTSGGTGLVSGEATEAQTISDYLIPIKVSVLEEKVNADGTVEAVKTKRDQTEVEGYITDESIR
ncbi:prepilin-type N-terminal cleavage/methylation domain-containing protein [Paenibacillus aurantiacus]|uniref:Prepilin-type N-terminal cleavage/methylation domain-containing protein n=1 Tax=Paenibacillus aurantiacus TaxID=1936118 RepID=A0ABV5KIZ6_9BACL